MREPYKQENQESRAFFVSALPYIFLDIDREAPERRTGAKAELAGPAPASAARAERAGGPRDDLSRGPDHPPRDLRPHEPVEADGLGGGAPARARGARPSGRPPRRAPRTQADV